MASKYFHKGKKLCLLGSGPRRITNAVKDYVYDVEIVINRRVSEKRASRHKFYSDASFDEKVLMAHVLTSETDMQL